MPFVPMPSADHRVCTFENLPLNVLPQHQEFIFSDPISRSTERLFIYTGEIKIEHGTEQASRGITFQYPVLGTFIPTGTATVFEDRQAKRQRGRLE